MPTTPVTPAPIVAGDTSTIAVPMTDAETGAVIPVASGETCTLYYTLGSGGDVARVMTTVNPFTSSDDRALGIAYYTCARMETQTNPPATSSLTLDGQVVKTNLAGEVLTTTNVQVRVNPRKVALT